MFRQRFLKDNRVHMKHQMLLEAREVEKRSGDTERADFKEWPLSSRTAKEVLRAKQPSSLQTPSHLSVWLVTPTGNCRQTVNTPSQSGL